MASSFINMPSTSRNNDNSSVDSSESETSDSEVEASVEEYETESEGDIDYNPSWAPSTQGLRRFIFTGENKLFVGIPGQNRPIDWFLLLLDVLFLEAIVCETNKYAREVFFPKP